MLKLQPQEFELHGRNGQSHKFVGILLGAASSRTDEHTHSTRYAARGRRCSACRWFDVAIYQRTVPTWSQVNDAVEDDYVVHTVGASIVPGENRLSRVEYTASPFEVLELLTIRHGDRKPFIMTQSSRALAQAAELDEGIREAYVNRAVV